MPLTRAWSYPALTLRLLRMTAKISSVQRNRPVNRSLLRLIILSAGSWDRCQPLREAFRAAAIAEIIRRLCDSGRYKTVARLARRWRDFSPVAAPRGNRTVLASRPGSAKRRYPLRSTPGRPRRRHAAAAVATP